MEGLATENDFRPKTRGTKYSLLDAERREERALLQGVTIEVRYEGRPK